MTDKSRSMPEIVAKYLRKDPDFLLKHPEILDLLNLPHESGEAVSLIEKQVHRLREQNRALSRKLNQLIQVATDNEALMTRLHKLTLELMVIDGLGPFFDHLSESLLNEFKADILNISLFDREVDSSAKTPVFSLRRDDPDLKPLQEQLEKGQTVCGRLSRNKLDFLFGNRGQWVQSTALVPLGNDGLLAIGSSDPAYFYPGMGTLFLDLLATVITQRLELEEPSKQRRSA
jgi:uncharacterized protein YigA (DUF484 family)